MNGWREKSHINDRILELISFRLEVDRVHEMTEAERKEYFKANPKAIHFVLLDQSYQTADSHKQQEQRSHEILTEVLSSWCLLSGRR